MATLETIIAQMDPDLVDRWVEDLRTTTAGQCHQTLAFRDSKGEKFCCLGRLLVVADGWKPAYSPEGTIDYEPYDRVQDLLGYSASLPAWDRTSSPFWVLNDGDEHGLAPFVKPHTFPEIADAIDQARGVTP